MASKPQPYLLHHLHLQGPLRTWPLSRDRSPHLPAQMLLPLIPNSAGASHSTQIKCQSLQRDLWGPAGSSQLLLSSASCFFLCTPGYQPPAREGSALSPAWAAQDCSGQLTHEGGLLQPPHKQCTQPCTHLPALLLSGTCPSCVLDTDLLWVYLWSAPQ